ncbi:MAG: sodium:proton antiporter, partial [Erysipelotrichaceae bacterium]|nr:sodium:proton antiporter [Erysipelotrichaceae bacterium]
MTGRSSFAHAHIAWTCMLESTAWISAALSSSATLMTVHPLRAFPSPMKFFWATGLLSSILDNSPTYVVFLTAA